MDGPVPQLPHPFGGARGPDLGEERSSMAAARCGKAVREGGQAGPCVLGEGSRTRRDLSGHVRVGAVACQVGGGRVSARKVVPYGGMPRTLLPEQVQLSRFTVCRGALE
ncbi:hypothetical protein [Nonomuraea sp. NPDC052265]|uniref:hypothetical protein n=1 Tax=Nonomuraea sp. NPDC052265 TaxID=3364374 RepID=UPI0037C87632